MSQLKRYRLAVTTIGLMLVALVALAVISNHYNYADQSVKTAERISYGKVDDDSTARVIVKSNNHALKDQLVAKQNLKKLADISNLDISVYEVPEGSTAKEVSAKLSADLEQGNPHQQKKDQFAEPDKIVGAAAVPNDPGYPSQWHLPNVSEPTAWDTTTGNKNITIAILDSGVDPAHPDLSPNMITGANFCGSSDTACPYQANPTTDTHDVQGHGTAVAGTASAVGNNSLGVSGGLWNESLMPVRISYNNNGGAYAYWSTVAQGMMWAIDHAPAGSKVIENVSYVGLSSSSTIQNAADYVVSKNGLFFACAGNDAVNPGFSNYPSIIIVSATDGSNNKASFSDFGPFVDLSAPGTSMYTTTKGSSYGTWAGTSFSSPLAASVAGLVWSANANLTNSQVRSILYDTADDLGTAGWDQNFGWGKVNAAKAVAAAISTPQTTDTTPPSVPANLTATATSSTQVNLSWTASTDNVGVAGYQLTRNNSLIATLGASATKYSDIGLIGGSTYSYSVKAYDSAGNFSGPSNTATVTTPGFSFILSPSVSGKTSTSAVVSWQTSVPATAVVNYGTSKNNLNQTVNISTLSAKQSATLVNLTKQTTYYYKVTVRDANGNSLSSSVSSLRTTNK